MARASWQHRVGSYAARFAELMEDQVLPGADDRHIELPYSVLGRLVPGTDLIVAYIPALDEVYVIALLRI